MKPFCNDRYQMLQAESLEFDASPLDGLLIGIERVHAAHERINDFVLNFYRTKDSMFSPRVTAAQQHDGLLLGCTTNLSLCGTVYRVISSFGFCSCTQLGRFCLGYTRGTGQVARATCVI